MVGKSKTPTKAEKARMDTLKNHCPCICCMLATMKVSFPEIHHITDCGRRKGHDFTLSLCPYHHRGAMEWQGAHHRNKQQLIGEFGPSLAHGKRTFAEMFGGEMFLLSLQNDILEAYEDSEWQYYNVPEGVRVDIQHKWKSSV